ncbi:four helix bundle protein [Mucilaginibacter sp.]|uniref:four helix bundle protein n=1 Tax=Mucilaginibacter sp. TaxID=1882438 RepID=UPI000CC21C6E|nr:four helix bundle protein [Mucilaginibacter sp.]PLW89891.1 MAG: four helix bundle protein [Mucilaginibacter sp.]PMP65595.1 MAG: four helix bundle protein [Mucilaginibacter sp.]PMP65891.1 MAG: four helix bundle protein [Mucilaginibacter sp.]HEK19266.1 four helix bundle protein [Bacteroidota bacterium]
MKNDKENLIVALTFEFALHIITFCEELESQKKYVISKQLIRSGISIGANVREAQNAESKADFIHKMKIAAKEADETEYFLLLCQSSKTYPFDPTLLDKLISIIKIISKIIASSKAVKTFSNLQITQ